MQAMSILTNYVITAIVNSTHHKQQTSNVSTRRSVNINRNYNQYNSQD